MTKKHYEAIARILSNMQLVIVYDQKTVKETAENLAYYFEQDNKNFDRARFLSACGIGETCRHCDTTHTDGIMHECPDNH